MLVFRKLGIWFSHVDIAKINTGQYNSPALILLSVIGKIEGHFGKFQFQHATVCCNCTSGLRLNYCKGATVFRYIAKL